MSFENQKSPYLVQKVDPKESEMKDWLVDYVGNKLNPESGEVTVEMIVGVMADEFPEFLLAIAEENFTMGYKQGLADSEAWQNLKDKGNVKC